VRATAAPALRVAAGVASSTGEVAATWRLEPHRQVATLGGTRRPHSEQTQLVADGSRSLTIRVSAADRVRRLTNVHRFASDGNLSAYGAKACLGDVSAEARQSRRRDGGRSWALSERGGDSADRQICRRTLRYSFRIGAQKGWCFS
jgi:hypothetical protein